MCWEVVVAGEINCLHCFSFSLRHGGGGEALEMDTGQVKVADGMLEFSAPAFFAFWIPGVSINDGLKAVVEMKR